MLGGSVRWRTCQAQVQSPGVPKSEHPSVWLDKVSNSAKVIALTCESDDNTQPELARACTEKLSARGVAASFKSIPNATHNRSFSTLEVFQAGKSLLESR